MSAKPRAGVGSDGQLARLLWLVLFSYYLLILGGHHYSIDGIVMFESARQLFFHHTLVLDPPVVWGTSVYRVSPYGIGLVLAYLPLLALQSPLLSWLPALQAIPYNPAVAYNPDL